jgi:NAD(P)-dependent dehydrogenase (short-subunit alcohol dehydrogenase family)
MEFEGKVVVVTGPGRGIGRATARAFGAAGAHVVLAETISALLDSASAEFSGEHRALPVRTDVTDPRSVQAMVDEAIATFGRIDVLVNNVGGGGGDNTLAESLEQWRQIIDLNLTSQFLCCKAVVPHMVTQRYGRIVNISSNAGRYLSRYFAPISYCAAKAGVSALTRMLAWQLGQHNIRANAIEPGHVWTELTQEQWPGFPEELRTRIISEIPLGRMAKPEDIANAVLFLASEDSGFMTGATLEVNGGLWMS